MGLQKITFDGANVTSKMDADLYHFLFSKDVGIFKDIKQECSFTLASNTITFLDGYVSIYGRIIYVENQTSVTVVPDSSKYGYVVLAVDTAANTISIYTKEAVGTYPTLTRVNLFDISGLYEFVLCAYSKTTTSVTLATNYQLSYIYSDKRRVDTLSSELKTRSAPVKQTLTKIQNGVYQFGGTSSVDLGESLVFVTIENTTVVTFPGQALFIFIGSNTSISYRYGGADYSLGVTYVGGVVTLSCGNTLHKITSVFLKK
jgi:hypothetical protein